MEELRSFSVPSLHPQGGNSTLKGKEVESIVSVLKEDRSIESGRTSSSSNLPEATETPKIKHLVVLVHGLNGGSNDLNAIKAHLTEITSEIVVHSAECNHGSFKTLDGIDSGGERLAKEIEEFASKHPSIQEFSIIGHSLGGLYARYCIGLLYKQNFFEKVKPLNFISLATPHMGSRRSPKGIFNPIVSWITKSAFSRTGKQLMLEDGDDESSGPLLVRMSRRENCWLQALQSFEKRITYSNVYNDFNVPYCTSAIVPRNPYTKTKISYHKDFNHIVNCQSEVMMEKVNYEECFLRDGKRDFLVEMLLNLQTLQWERVDVLFSTFFSHEQIVARRSWRFDNGLDIVRHLGSSFASS